MFSQGWFDLRHAARVLAKRWRHSALVVLTLALGIGAATAVFAVLRPILLEPVPYPNADRLVRIVDLRTDGRPLYSTFGDFRMLAETARSFDALAAYKGWQAVVAGGGPAERLSGQKVSADFFRTLGISPALGRDFVAGDDLPNVARVAILSDALWRQRFGADPAILGRAIRLDDEAYTVVGVLPAGFGNVMDPAAAIYAPLAYDPALPAQGREWGHHLRVLGRVGTAVTPAQLNDDLGRVLQAMATRFPDQLKDGGMPRAMAPTLLADELTAGVRPTLTAIAGAVLLVLLIACVNVANLQLARSIEDQGDLRIRQALGAGRTRLLRGIVLESLVSALAAAATGFLLACNIVALLRAIAPAELPALATLSPGPRDAVFALATALVAALVIAAPAATQLFGGGDNERRTQRVIGGRQRARRALVIAEVALALVLLVGAGLLLQSVRRLFEIHPGFDSAGLVTLHVQSASHRFDDAAAAQSYGEQVLDAVRALPGVTRAAWTSQLPFSGDFDQYGVSFEAGPGEPPSGGYGAMRYAVSPGYLGTMGIALLRGREIGADDQAGTAPVAVISAALAHARFGDADPIGKRLHVGRTDLPWFTVVGVAADVKQASLRDDDGGAVYVGAAQWYFTDTSPTLVVRTAGDPLVLAAALKSTVAAIDADHAVVRVAVMDQLLKASEAERRFALALFEAFGALALLLAAVGVYGVLAANVVDRRREIGVRIALGARADSVARLVIRQGMGMMLPGIALGVVASLLLSRFLQNLLFGIGTADAPTYVVIVALLLVVALAACWWPARRAATVDPLIAIRSE